MLIDFKKMRDSEWDYTMSGGSLLAHICPACCAHIPMGNDGLGVSYRSRHIEWHQFLQARLTS